MNSKMWMLRSHKAEAREGVVRLTPAFEEFLLGWKSRSFALPDRYESAVVSGGIFRPVLISDGRVVGTWALRRKAVHVDVAVRPFQSTAPAVLETVRQEANDIGRFMQLVAELAIERPPRDK